MSNEGKINAYTCTTCGRKTITVDRAEGVTPFMIQCPWCGEGDAQSAFYRVPQDLEPTHEWYTPDDAELGDLMAFPEGRNVYEEHIKRGGLVLKRIGGETFTAQLKEKLNIGVPDYTHCENGCETSCTSAVQQVNPQDVESYLKIQELTNQEGLCILVDGCRHCSSWKVRILEQAQDEGAGWLLIDEHEESLFEAVEHALYWSDVLKIPALIEPGRAEYALSQDVMVVIMGVDYADGQSPTVD